MFTRIAALCAVVCLLPACASLSPAKPKPFTVSENGAAQARIMIAEQAPPSTVYAAEELQRFLGEITGTTYDIARDNTKLERGDIVLGRSKYFDELTHGTVKLESLGTEGYVIKTSSKHLIIAGGEPRGTLYGVYGLLEDHLGCRWFTPAVSRIPKNASLTIAPIDQTFVPRLEYREPFVQDCFEGTWQARNRMNSATGSLEEKHGGRVKYVGFVHTFDQLVPPAQYFDTHPEYFSLVKGARLKERTQLCCTNEDVVQIVIAEIRKRMKDNPDSTVFSVSQNDWYNYCECDKCTALANAEGSQIAPVLYLVNRVAEAVATEFPDKLIDTLAYQYTRKPPTTMRPLPNVIIRLCSIECCFSHSFEACDSEENKTFVADVVGWSKKCDRLWVWNYNTSFANYFTPYPNLRVRNDNIKFFADHNVTGIFEQDTYTTLNGELNGLSGYINAKFLWNPDYDENTAINEFLDGVYGPAAKPIREYLDMLHDRVERENIHMDIWIGPDHPAVNDEILAKSDALWDHAEALVKDSPDVLARVQAGRMAVDYAIIERARATGLRLYSINQDTGEVAPSPDFVTRVNRFFDQAVKTNATNIRENNGDINLYKQELEKVKSIGALPVQKPAKVGKLKPGLRLQTYEGNWNVLPDFTKLKPVETGVAEKVDLSVTPRRELVGLVFSGYVHAPADGVYVFSIASNDGSKLMINGQVLIDNDGLHKYSGQSGAVRLSKGYHAIRVEYFETSGKEGLDVAYEGPGIPYRPIPLAAISH